MKGSANMPESRRRGVPPAFTDLGSLLCRPTPLHRADQLAAAFGVRELWIKRDDLIGPGLGGNKARKLERLIADAQRWGADCLVTVGAAQSNHARMTAVLGAIAGLDVHLLLGGTPTSEGNALLDTLAGANLHFVADPGWSALDDAARALSARLSAAGRRVYEIPLGGSNEVGAAAFFSAYDELREQIASLEIAPDCIVHASSSGGTQAGLVAGYIAAGRSGPSVVGIDVAKGTLGLQEKVPTLVDELLRADPSDSPRDREDVNIVDPIGLPYGASDPDVARAIQEGLRSAGILCDPVYSGRALLSVKRLAGSLPDRVVFWHTGGEPANFTTAYAGVGHDAVDQGP